MIAIAGATHAGKTRASNEDRVAIDGGLGVAIVADGMGGTRGGEEASRAACEAVLALLQGQPAAGLGEAFAAAAQAVDTLQGPGATLAAFRIDPADRVVEIATVGDVRVYVVRKTIAAPLASAQPAYAPVVTLASGGAIACVTRDHSSVCELVERGHLPREDAKHHPLRSRVTRALGGSDPRAEVRVIPLVAGDRLVACSDGVWSAIDDAVIGGIVADSAAPTDACEGIIRAALDAGGPDNIGVAIAFWSPRVSARRDTVADEEVDVARVAAADPLAALLAFGRDLTAEARAGRLDAVVGRDGEIRELARVLVQRRTPNALLVGEPGVGKTAIVEGLARRIAAPGADPAIARMRIVELSLTDLVAGARHRGDLEERVAKVLKATEAVPDAVVFIDEIHQLGPSESPDGNASTIASALKPALARGAIRVIGATTVTEHERYLARDEAFARRFARIDVAEPAPGAATEMLAGLRDAAQAHYRVKITDDALHAAVDLASYAHPDRRLPASAIELLERACARVMLGTLSGHASPTGPREPVDRRAVAIAVAERSGIALDVLLRDSRGRIEDVEATLRERLVGQDAAIDVIGRTLRRTSSPARDPERPVSLFLAGPPGAGMTTAAMAIPAAIHGRDAIVMVGADLPGALEQLRRRPRSVVIALDVDRTGVAASLAPALATFRDAVVVMTGARVPDELTAWVDDVAEFRALGEADRPAIVERAVGRVEDRLRARGIEPPAGMRERVLARLAAPDMREAERLAETDAIAPPAGILVAIDAEATALAREGLSALRAGGDVIVAVYDTPAAALASARGLLARSASARVVVHAGKPRASATLPSVPADARLTITDAAREHLPAGGEVWLDGAL